MSFMLSELDVVRLICKGESCRTVFEIKISKLDKAMVLKCPCCSRVFREGRDDDPFTLFSEAVRLLLKNDSNADVEFVIPCKE